MNKEEEKRFENFYNELSREELIGLLMEKSEELKLGKVFATLEVEESMDSTLHWRGRQRFLTEKVFPVKLIPVIEKSCNPEKGDNLIINGDNLSTMSSLLKDYRGKVDVIYMDPPYNTGNESFPYNDSFLLSKSDVKNARKELGRSCEIVSLDDPSRHTKWINHIAPRLWAAKKLMKPTGVIIISIDEHELPRLWILMEEIFGANNRIATLIWERARKNDTTYISEGHEYMLVWARDKTELDAVVQVKGKWRSTKPGLDIHMGEYRRLRELHGNDHDTITKGLKEFVRGIDKRNSLWTVRQYTGVDEKSDLLGPYKEDDPSWPSGGGPRYDVIHPVTGNPVKIPANGWRHSDKQEWDSLISDNRIVWKKIDKGIPKIKKYLLEGRDIEVLTSVIQKEARGAVLLSKAIFGDNLSYPNPKDHEILHKLFNLCTWQNPNAIILDPYAGSGTTAHAVITMNAEDNGNRQFILIEGGYVSKKASINQKEYTDKITAERIRRVISGNWKKGKPRTGYETGFTFFDAANKITKEGIMASDRENLSDIILQAAEEESNRTDCRIKGFRYLIGHTRSGLGLALVWEPGKEGRSLTMDVLKTILGEANAQGCAKPIHIYAASNQAPFADSFYRFHQIPDAILAKLGITGLVDDEDGVSE